MQDRSLLHFAAPWPSLFIPLCPSRRRCLVECSTTCVGGACGIVLLGGARLITSMKGHPRAMCGPTYLDPEPQPKMPCTLTSEPHKLPPPPPLGVFEARLQELPAAMVPGVALPGCGVLGQILGQLRAFSQLWLFFLLVVVWWASEVLYTEVLFRAVCSPQIYL